MPRYQFRNEKGNWISDLKKGKVISFPEIDKAKTFDFKNRGEAKACADMLNALFGEDYRPLTMNKKYLNQLK